VTGHVALSVVSWKEKCHVFEIQALKKCFLKYSRVKIERSIKLFAVIIIINIIPS
jgi:hypothetical protein